MFLFIYILYNGKRRYKMNEKLQYATMLDIPVNSCSITRAPLKKKKSKNKKSRSDEEIKKELLDKVNSANEKQEVSAEAALATTAEIMNNDDTEPQAQGERKRGFKFTVVTAQLILIGALIATIFLTNAFYENSGINAFMRSVFTPESTVEGSTETDSREYGEFNPVVAYGGSGSPVIDEGVMTIEGKGSAYTPYDGTVTKITVDGAGKYTLEISHSDKFKSMISGLDYAYAEIGDNVFANIPVGYSGESGIKMCFLDGNGTVITGYTLEGSAVVWKEA